MKLNTQGNEIVTAIKAGIAAGGVDEWDSPEFEAARKASEGYVWEFAGWADTLACIERHGALGGDSLRRQNGNGICDNHAVPVERW